jgi:hypothetical protein
MNWHNNKIKASIRFSLLPYTFYLVSVFYSYIYGRLPFGEHAGERRWWGYIELVIGGQLSDIFRIFKCEEV